MNCEIELLPLTSPKFEDMVIGNKLLAFNNNEEIQNLYLVEKIGGSEYAVVCLNKNDFSYNVTFLLEALNTNFTPFPYGTKVFLEQVRITGKNEKN